MRCSSSSWSALISVVQFFALRDDTAELMASLTADRSSPDVAAGSRRPGFCDLLRRGVVLASLFVLPLLWAVFRSFQPTDLVGQPRPQASDFTT